MWGQPPSAVRQAKLGISRAADRARSQAEILSSSRVTCESAPSSIEPRSTDGRRRPSPHRSKSKSLAGRGEVRDFHSRRNKLSRHLQRFISADEFGGNAASDAGFAMSMCDDAAPNSGHRLVDGLHSIENTCTYKRVFFVDGKNRRSTTGSFFDSFLSFSGWCGVRGSSGVTVLIARLGRRVSKGL